MPQSRAPPRAVGAAAPFVLEVFEDDDAADAPVVVAPPVLADAAGAPLRRRLEAEVRHAIVWARPLVPTVKFTALVLLSAGHTVAHEPAGELCGGAQSRAGGRAAAAADGAGERAARRRPVQADEHQHTSLVRCVPLLSNDTMC